MPADSPLTASWVAALHSSEQDFSPLGTAVVIDERRALTSAHVVKAVGEPRREVWVAFPWAEDPATPRLRAQVRLAAHPMADLAVVELDEPIPAGVAPAPLRCPKPVDVVGRAWWAFGFARRDPLGNEADGTVGASLGYGWVRLDTDSRYHVEPGFSGGGLWCSDYSAVVGVVGEANDRGDGRAITLYQADAYLPAEKISLLAQWTVAAADEVAQTAWGWALARDVEADRHWRPHARGVSVASERGHRFRGRRTALTEIVAWLDRAAPDRRVLVVTGSPGVGKSAVLGRIVTTADAEMRAALPQDDDAVPASVGSIGCAVHAKGKTALDVAMEIARAASAALPERVEDLPVGLREALTERGGRRFNIVIDALDEASDPAQTRAMITRIVLPIARTCADVGAQVLVGTRRSDDAGELLRVFGVARHTIDLDDTRYFALDDLAAFAQTTLQLRGDERPGNPYQPDDVAARVATRIAAMAEQNFLVAGLVAQTHGLYDDNPIRPDQLAFTPSVEAALAAFLDRLAPVAGVPARDLLTALAFAAAPGLTVELWQLAVRALTGAHLEVHQLTRFARGSAANFLVESPGDATATFRLFHQALSDALHSERAQFVPTVEDERALTTAMVGYGVRIGWDRAPTYLFRSLPGHAHRAGMLDELLLDTRYVLRADLRRLIPAAAHAHTLAGAERARLLRLTPSAVPAEPAERLAMLTVSECLDGAGTTFRDHPEPAAYRASWSRTQARTERSVLETGRVTGMCAVRVEGRELLALAGADGPVRIWDPATGNPEHVLEGHTGEVHAVCAVHLAGQELLASAGDDRMVRIWDPATGNPEQVLEGHTGRVHAMCALDLAGRDLLALAGAGGKVRIWDPATGNPEQVLEGHTGRVFAVCVVHVAGRVLLASAGADYTVRIWDPATGKPEQVLEGHTGGVFAVCVVHVAGRVLLASAGDDYTVRIWDPATGNPEQVLEGHTGRVRAVCAVHLAGRELLASAGDDRTVRIWDPATGNPEYVLGNHTGRMNAMCAVHLEGRDLLASAGADYTVRIWDPATGNPEHVLEGHTDWVRAVCAVHVEGRVLLASAGADRKVRIWDPATGNPEQVLEGHTDWVRAVCAVHVEGRVLLASAGADDTVRIWDPATGKPEQVLEGHTGRVFAVCAVHVEGRVLLASAGADRKVRIWDPATGNPEQVLEGHTGRVFAVCAVHVEGRVLLASAGADYTVRIWDPATGNPEQVLENHTGRVFAVCAVHLAGRELLASAGDDRTVRIWDPATGNPEQVLEGHTDWVRAVCVAHLEGRELLASAGDDRTVRIWDPSKGTAQLVIPVHYQVLALTSIEGYLGIGTNAGLLAVGMGRHVRQRTA